MKKMAVVVPTHLPEMFEVWRRAWLPALEGKVDIITVWDMPRSQLSSGFVDHETTLFWEDGEKYGSLIGDCHKSSSMRNLGFLKAAELGYTYIGTLDHDTLPTDNLWVDRMLQCLSRTVDPYTFWPAQFRTRGMAEPFQVPVILHHGLWEGIPDVYAKDQYVFEMLDGKQHPVVTIPYGTLAPLCGMNIAFHRKFLPAMYFWPQKKYVRWDDIWCGLIAKRVADIVGFSVTSGSPTVYHNRLSDRVKSAKDEENGMRLNRDLWTLLVTNWPRQNRCETFTDPIFESTKKVIDLLPNDLLKDAGCDYPAWWKACEEVLK